jgi:response regulator RpfG family c-di-GMP phosphodiesterase
MTDNKPAILVVDDEAEILYSLRGLLRKDYDFHAAPSGYEGLRVLDRVPVQVVMADQRMPEMTGVDFLAHVRARHPDVTRLLMTGYADLSAVIAAVNEGQVSRYITKPWDPDALMLVLREAQAQHGQLADRRRLLADLNSYLGSCTNLLDGLRQGKPDAAAEAERLSRDGKTLLGRVGEALSPTPAPRPSPP